jgi:hypothetical protein
MCFLTGAKLSVSIPGFESQDQRWDASDNRRRKDCTDSVTVWEKRIRPGYSTG